MALRPSLVVKIASEDWEFEAISRLNHRTFAEEIRQHQATASGRLIDRFHGANTYVIALAGRSLAGMLAIGGTRPFSLDEKLQDLDAYLTRDRAVCELRLLAVDRPSRAGALLPRLLAAAWRHTVHAGFDLAVISAITTQAKLYRHLGFEAFGALVGGPPGPCFQPMMLTLERFAARAPRLFRRATSRPGDIGCFLPGPVDVREEVRRAFEHPPQSHRSAAFARELSAVKTFACARVRAANVEVLLGSGTLANDVVAGQLSLLHGRGLILSNGEFGERLIDHGRRATLDFDVITKPWGEAIDVSAVERFTREHRACAWLWFVHCETSTGVVQDLAHLAAVADRARMKLCVDAISSIGVMDVDLSTAWLASGVSGKGLGAYPGLSMVFYDHAVQPAPSRLPRLLDLGLYAREGGVPFTHSSNLIGALRAALDRDDWPARVAQVMSLAAWLRTRLKRLGFVIIGNAETGSPGIVTIAMPPSVSAVAVSDELERRGALVSANSRYLRDRNWLQIALMGEHSMSQLSTLTIALVEACQSVPRAVAIPVHAWL